MGGRFTDYEDARDSEGLTPALDRSTSGEDVTYTGNYVDPATVAANEYSIAKRYVLQSFGEIETQNRIMQVELKTLFETLRVRHETLVANFVAKFEPASLQQVKKTGCIIDQIQKDQSEFFSLLTQIEDALRLDRRTTNNDMKKLTGTIECLVEQQNEFANAISILQTGKKESPTALIGARLKTKQESEFSMGKMGSGLCLSCGKKLSWTHKLFGSNAHRKCTKQTS